MTFSYIIGPLPFCVPLAEAADVGPGTAFPLEAADIDAFCEMVWRVKAWRCEISGLSNEFASYEDYSLDFANHEKTGDPPPGTVIDIIPAPGLNIEHEYSVLDNFGESNTFRIRITGLDGGRHLEDPLRLYAEFNIELDLLLPGSPPEEIALRTIAGTSLAGTLEMNGITTELYCGFPGQITDTWVGNITIYSIDTWSFEP